MRETVRKGANSLFQTNQPAKQGKIERHFSIETKVLTCLKPRSICIKPTQQVILGRHSGASVRDSIAASMTPFRKLHVLFELLIIPLSEKGPFFGKFAPTLLSYVSIEITGDFMHINIASI